MKFLHDLTHRNGQGSSKKFWYNIAGLTATAIVLWVCYKDTMEDYAFICLFAVYLLTVGGFEVILKSMQMIVDLKSGNSSPKVTEENVPQEKVNVPAIPIVP